MAENKITTNFIFNVLLTLSTYIAQLIVYPYVSRVLGVEAMGSIGFINKTIDIFLIFSTLGINTIGIREIAAVKGDKQKLNEVFSGLTTFITVSTLIVSLVYLVAILYVSKFNIYSDYFLVGLSKLVFSTFLIEWFYQGIEDFRFITIRSVIVKILYIATVFVFVRNSGDTFIYFVLTIGVVVLNSFINWLSSRKYVKFSFSFSNMKGFARPMLWFGAYQLLNAAFSTFNYLFLGFISTEEEVGYYYTAENFYFILLALVSTFTKVMLPRMSSILSNNDSEKFRYLIDRSFDFILSIGFPIMILGVYFAPQIIVLFSGPGYEGAISPFRIMMALVLINGINQVFILQIATPHKLDKEIFIGTLMGTILALSVNYSMINNWGAIGAAVVLVISVIVANIYPIAMIFQKKLIPIPSAIFFRQLLLSIPYCIICFLSAFIPGNKYIIMVIISIICVTYYLAFSGRPYIKIVWNTYVKRK